MGERESTMGKRPKRRGEEPEGADPLGAPTSSLGGIGPAFAAKLAERGLSTVEDLLWIAPRRYDDLRAVPALSAQLPGAFARVERGEAAAVVSLIAVARSVRPVFARGRRWVEARFGDEVDADASLLVRWFGARGGLEQRLPPGVRVVLTGALRASSPMRGELANPEIVEVLAAGQAAAPRIFTQYPPVRGVPPSRLRQACAAACARVAGLADDGVPSAVEGAAGLPPLAEALSVLHAPPLAIGARDLEHLCAATSRWHRRLVFGELFALAAAVAQRKAERRGDRALVCPPIAAADRLTGALPFALTGAQRRAIAELERDLAADAPMNRLLEGDVGAGKTLVALAAALQVARAGAQVALMAPTAVLAEQHAAGLRPLAAALGLRLGLLTAATARAEADVLRHQLASGELPLVVGTHALLSEGVAPARLGLCIIDEQHRFGVAQRAALRGKGPHGITPHLLVMTATPIPRTLALTAYGDLECSILDELPPGRRPAKTRVLRGARGHAEAKRALASRIAAGGQAFVVCARIEPSDDAEDDARDALSVHAELTAELGAVGLVHGKLEPARRDQVMRQFRDGTLRALVATTVIEVGVDVPAASLMLIFDADRFGLAQLHQLRGRVGRGGGASECLLLLRGTPTEEGARRLEVMAETSDGFRIAEEDLRLRGPGELLGARQAGVPRLRFGSLSDHVELLEQARRAAEDVLARDPRLERPEHAALARVLHRRLAGEVAIGAESG